MTKGILKLHILLCVVGTRSDRHISGDHMQYHHDDRSRGRTPQAIATDVDVRAGT